MQTKQYHFQNFSFSLGFFSSNLSKETLGQERLIKGASKKTIIDRNFFSSLLESEHFFLNFVFQKICMYNIHIIRHFSKTFRVSCPLTAPPMPTLSGVTAFSTKIEAIIGETTSTVSAEEYYDSANKKAAIFVLISGEQFKIIYDYDTNEIFYVNREYVSSQKSIF